jgi:hypothetical protein
VKAVVNEAGAFDATATPMVIGGKLVPAPVVEERVAVRLLELNAHPVPLIDVMVRPAGS